MLQDFDTSVILGGGTIVVYCLELFQGETVQIPTVLQSLVDDFVPDSYAQNKSTFPRVKGKGGLTMHTALSFQEEKCDRNVKCFLWSL